MGSHANPFPPNPSLQAILLVIKSGTGPRCVLSYPPEPIERQRHNRSRRSARGAKRSSEDGSGDDSFSDIEDEDTDSNGLQPDRHHWSSARQDRQHRSHEQKGRKEHGRSSLRHEVSNGRSRASGTGSNGSGSKTRTAPSVSAKVKGASEGSIGHLKSLSDAPGDTFLGYSTDSLAKLLCPSSRKWHKRRLEVTLNGHCFVGCPMFCREDGRWVKPVPNKRAKGKTHGEAEQQSQDNTDRAEDVDAQQTTEADDSTAEEGENARHLDTQGDSISPQKTEIPISSLSSTPSSADWSRSGSQSQTYATLQLFNVVMVLHPPALEHQMRVREVYANVVKTLAAALRHQQRREGYVWNETRIIMASREKAAEKGMSAIEAWHLIAAESSLARALATTFDYISRSLIAHISLGSSLDLSLQIPQALSTAHAPTPQNPQIPGLWLTSADLTTSHDGAYGTTISPQSALLLLVSPERLTRELTASSEQAGQKAGFAGPLGYFIRHCNPTKTLLQLSKKLRLSLPDLQFLSLHLIRWRRARAITPLHQSHIYIPSPNANMHDLSAAQESFRRRFTAVPDLASVLAKLGDNKSNAPRPWSAMIPSTDHKQMYMEVLAWLVKGGWICQIRTFAWVIVRPETKRAVEKEIRREEREARASLVAAALHETIEEETLAEDQSTADTEADAMSVVKRRLSDESGRTNTQSLFSPRMRATLFPPKPGSVTGSVSSGQTAVRITNAPGSDHKEHSETVSKDHSRQPSNEVTTEDDVEIDSKVYETSLVLSPHKSSPLESRWLEYIGKSLPDAELQQAWPSLVKYFDGQHAIEEIAIREDKKRKLLNPILIQLIAQPDVLRIVRHW